MRARTDRVLKEWEEAVRAEAARLQSEGVAAADATVQAIENISAIRKAKVAARIASYSLGAKC